MAKHPLQFDLDGAMSLLISLGAAGFFSVVGANSASLPKAVLNGSMGFGVAGAALAESFKVRRSERLSQLGEDVEEMLLIEEATATYQEIVQPINPYQFTSAAPNAIAPALDIIVQNLEDIEFNDFKKSPHWMILAPTGWGKTTLLTAIINRIKGDIVITDTHAEPGNWKGLEILGKGRRNEEVYRMIELTLEEVNQRYYRRDKGDTSYPDLTSIVEEFPAIKKRMDSNSKDEKLFRDWFETCLLEARKVHLRKIFIAQGKSRKTLGIDGQTELLENLNIIRGGQFALDHAKAIKNIELYRWLQQQERPATINDDGLIIPGLKGIELEPRHSLHAETVELIAKIRGLEKGTQSEPRKRSQISLDIDLEKKPTNIEVSDSNFGAEAVEDAPDDGGEAPAAPEDVHRLESLLHKDSTDSTNPISDGWKHPDPSCEPTPEVRATILRCYRCGWSKTKICETIWGLTKSGTNKKYKAAAYWYDSIISEINED